MKRREIAVMLMAGLFLALAGAADTGRPKPRALDVINTRVRDALFEQTMKLVPKPMVDPALDAGEVFSYFARPSYQLGIRGEPQATQVTDNGHLWTGAAEWLALVGDPPQPLEQRLYTLEKGYLPCITYSVARDGVVYTARAFQFWLTDQPGAPPVNFIQVIAANPGPAAAQASFSGGFMYGPQDHRAQRMRQLRFNPAWSYEMTEHAAVRDGKLIYAWREKPSRREARPGQAYERAFRGVARTAPVCLSTYQGELQPGERKVVEFAVPHYPADIAMESALAKADFSERRAAMEKYWEGWLSRGAHFEVNEPKVMNATKSYIIHALMCQNIVSENEVEQHVNRFQYNRFWLRDSSFFVSMYEKWGYPEVGEALARHFFRFQKPDGNFVSQKGQYDGWGQTMWALGTHVAYNEDAEFAEEALPYVQRAIDWLERALANDAWGLMPPTDAFDNEQVIGRYTGHNFWALTGLDSAIRLCELAGRDDLAGRYQVLRDKYFRHLMEVLRQTAAERGGLIPPALDVPGGIDWGNLLPLYPGNLLEPFDPLVSATFAHYRREHMVEGIATYGRYSMHHYLTERVAETELIRGEQELALADFYAMLVHTGACHEGFEWNVFPWDGRDYCMSPAGIQTCNFTPHGWYAANMNILFRNMLVREERRTLHLLSAISPEWAKPGERIVVEKAPTIFAPISFSIDFTETAAKMVVKTEWCSCTMPEAVVIHIPYFLKLKSASIEGKPAVIAGNQLRLTPDTQWFVPAEQSVITLAFERLSVAPMSYAGAVQKYKDEYRRRWEERER